jgi:type II secretory pathway pseudopilin PulG
MKHVRAKQSGFLLLAVLAALLVAGLALAAASEPLAHALQREKEIELLHIGHAYEQAIESYYNATPGPIKLLPMKLEELVHDNRFATPRRHLRKPFRDPLDPSLDWGLLRAGQRIQGVYSLAAGQPIQQAGFTGRHSHFNAATLYADWRFYFQPAVRSLAGEKKS